jgi:hypothetical protein
MFKTAKASRVIGRLDTATSTFRNLQQTIRRLRVSTAATLAVDKWPRDVTFPE